MERGWAINVGGGFHHSSKTQGEGFCVYADISLAIQFVFENFPEVHRILIIDLDAHQVILASASEIKVVLCTKRNFIYCISFNDIENVLY